MGFWIFMLCMNLTIPLVMIIFGVLFVRRPPRKINGLYGYRTARSMASPEAWSFAHAYMGRLWFRLGVPLFVLTVPAMLPCMGRGEDAVGLWGGILSVAECVVMILPVIPVERALKKHFS